MNKCNTYKNHNIKYLLGNTVVKAPLFKAQNYYDVKITI